MWSNGPPGMQNVESVGVNRNNTVEWHHRNAVGAGVYKWHVSQQVTNAPTEGGRRDVRRNGIAESNVIIPWYRGQECIGNGNGTMNVTEWNNGMVEMPVVTVEIRINEIRKQWRW